MRRWVWAAWPAPWGRWRWRLGRASSPAFIVALVGWGAPIALIGLAANPAVAILAMIFVGLSNAFLDVAGYTLIQRTTPNEAASPCSG